MKKKYILIFLVCVLTLSTIFFALTPASARYVKKLDTSHSLKSAEFYFVTNDDDIHIPYSNLNVDLDVFNFVGSRYSDKDINYSISISDGDGVDDNYNFSINGVDVGNSDTIDRTILGNSQNTDNLKISFKRVDDNTPPTEVIYMTIKSISPFVKTYKFKIIVMAPSGFDVIGNPTSWTNNDVTLTVVPMDDADIAEYSFDGGKTWSNTPSMTFTQNTDVSVATKDSCGNISSAVIPITKIDKVAPVITPIDGIRDSNLESNPLTATIDEPSYGNDLATVTDDLSGVNQYDIEIYKDGSNPQKIENTNYFSKVGWYKVHLKATDNAGNETIFSTSILVRWPKAGKYIVKRQDIVGIGISNSDTGAGLWKDTIETGYDSNLPYSSKYYYSGKEVNNYVNFSDTTFRVLNIADNDTFKLIAPLSSKSYGYEAWYSKLFKTSFYKSWGNDWIPNNRIYDAKDANNITVDFNSENSHVDDATFYAGVMSRDKEYSIVDIINEERTNDAKIAGGTSVDFKSKLALPTVSDYLKANSSLNIIYNIRKSQLNSTEFMEKSWLGSEVEQFTMTGCPGAIDNDFWVLYPNVGNEILSRTGYYNQKVRGVIYLKNDTILSGIGTLEEPFKVEESWDWFDNLQTLK